MTIAATLVAGTLGGTALRRAAAEVVLVAAGAALVALGARLTVVLPFTQVPITGQTFAVLLIREYLDCGYRCPACGRGFNPRCGLHHHLYFQS